MKRIQNLTLTLAATVVFAALAGCGERATTKATKVEAQPEPSAVVVGQAPAAPTGDPAGTTPVAPGTSDVSKTAESTLKPQEGDESSHSTLAKKTPQKADGNNTAAQRSTP